MKVYLTLLFIHAMDNLQRYFIVRLNETVMIPANHKFMVHRLSYVSYEPTHPAHKSLK